MKFGDNLKKIRIIKKLSQEALAEKVNVSRQSVSKWETGDAYPTMNNLLELCKIFHCKINDLVNDTIVDIDSLGDEVKTKVVSLNKEEQKKMKALSKIISIISKVGRIFCYIAIPFISLILIVSPYFINKVVIKDNNLTLNFSNHNINLSEKNDKVVLKVGNFVLADADKEFLNTKVIHIFENNSKAKIISYIETGFITLLVTIILTSIIFKHLETLFDNINKGETPFTLENVILIKKIAWKMIIIIIMSNIGSGVFELLLGTELNIEFETYDLVEILFLFSLSYIFEYGRLLGLETKGKMYGNNNEEN